MNVNNTIKLANIKNPIAQKSILMNKPPLKPVSEHEELKGKYEVVEKDNYLLVEKIREYEQIIGSLNER